MTKRILVALLVGWLTIGAPVLIVTTADGDEGIQRPVGGSD